MSRSASFASTFAALALIAAFGAPANAQTLQSRGLTVLEGGSHRNAIQNDVAVPISTTRAEPRFIINATRIYAVNETGTDWLGSDEPYAVFWDARAGDRLFTGEFGDVDTGETRRFAEDQSCMAGVGARADIHEGFPRSWWCDPAGRGGGINVRVELRESDDGSIWACGRAADAPAEPVSCQYNLIGRRAIRYTEAELVAMLPRAGAAVVREAQIGGYTFFYRIERVADVAVRDGPVRATQ